MPENPTWEFIGEAARKITDRSADINGICLRGKAGWGENMALHHLAGQLASAAAGSTRSWTPQFDQPEWKDALQFYADLMKDAGPAGASSNGFNENLTLFQQGKCGIWIDATSPASFVSNPKDSTVADKVAYTIFPNKEGVDNHGNWLWSWNLAIPTTLEERRRRQDLHRPGRPTRPIPSSSPRRRAGPTCRRAPAPRSTRTRPTSTPPPSPTRRKAAMDAADITKPTVRAGALHRRPVRAIPEFQSIGTTVGQLFSAVVAGQSHASTTRSPRPSRSTDARDDAAPATEVALLPAHLAARPRPGGPFPDIASRASDRRETVMATRQTQTHRPPDAAAVDPPAPDLDDRAAGDDALLLVPLLQPPEPLRRRLGRASRTTSYFLTDPAFWQAIRNTLCIVLGRAAHHRRRRHRHRAPDRPADLRPGDRAHPGDLAVLRDAAGRRAGLEEHDPAPGLRGRRRHRQVLRRARRSTGSPAYPLLSIIIIVAWQWLPFATLILLTSLQSLDSEQKEAAEMDGAGFVSRFMAT